MDRQLLKGLGASEGIGFGKLIILPDVAGLLDRGQPAWSAKDELLRYRAAKAKLIHRLDHAAGTLRREVDGPAGRVLDAHGLVLDDAVITQEIELNIEAGKRAVTAVELVFGRLAELQKKVQDAYLRERFTLWRNIGSELVMELLGGHRLEDARDAGDVIVAARELSPFALIHCPENIKGFALESGGPTDHTSILARAYKIPVVLGLAGLSKLERGVDAVIDGTRGELLVRAGEADRSEYAARLRTRAREPEHYAAQTVDGHRVGLLANAGIGAGPAVVERYNAEGIGLLRSEFLFLHRLEPPGEQEQFEAFQRVVQACPGKKVVIRTADFGGDKTPLFFAGDGLTAGLRGLRYCLAREEFFKTHLRAILRAGAYGDVRLLLPMVPGVSAFRQARALVRQAAEELAREKVPSGKAVPLGVMIEVPSAAVMAAALAAEADFFSIGTNDLCQYTLALDRAVPVPQGLLPPSIVHLVQAIVDAAHERQKPVGVCGELAGDAAAIPILLGLGVDELSMEPGRIPAARETIRKLSYAGCLALADRALKAETADEMRMLTAA